MATLIRVEGNRGSKVYRAYSPHDPIPVTINGDYLSVPETEWIMIWLHNDQGKKSELVAVFPSDWAVIELGARVEGPPQPGDTKGEEYPLGREYPFE